MLTVVGIGDSEQILVMAITKWRFLSKSRLFGFGELY